MLIIFLQKTRKAEEVKAAERFNFKKKWFKENWLNDDRECN